MKLREKLRGNRGSLRSHWRNLQKPPKIEDVDEIEEAHENEVDCPLEVASGLGWDPLGGICGQFGLDPRVDVEAV